MRVAAHGLEHRHDVALVGSRPDGAAVDEYRRAVEPRQRDQTARHVLVASADRHHAVKALGADHRLDRIGNDLARHQRVAHARRAHRNAVGHGNGAEGDGLRALRFDSGGGQAREFVDVHVTGRQVAPGRRDADLRLGEIGVAEAHGMQHRAGGSLFETIHNGSRIAARIVGPCPLRSARGRFGILSHASHRTVALEQVAIHAAYRLRLGADAASRPLPRIPGIQVEVQPMLGLGDEAFEKQGAEDRARETRRGDVIEIRDLAREFIVVCPSTAAWATAGRGPRRRPAPDRPQPLHRCRTAPATPAPRRPARHRSRSRSR